MDTDVPGRAEATGPGARETNDEPHGAPAGPPPPEASLGEPEPPAEPTPDAEPPAEPAAVDPTAIPSTVIDPVVRPSEPPAAEPIPQVESAVPAPSAVPGATDVPAPSVPAAPAARRRPSRLVTVLLAAGLALGLVVAGVVAVVAFTVLDPMFGYHPDDDTAAWAAHPLRFADTATCKECHTTEATAVAADDHARISCETCHGPLADHVAVATRDDPGPVAVETPPRGICITCHEQVAGRPEDQPQVDLATHYEGALCAQCHGVHELVEAKPPLVSHPRNNLPPCTVCHAPDGIRTLPAAHQKVPDEVCLRCHGPGEDRRLLLEGSS